MNINNLLLADRNKQRKAVLNQLGKTEKELNDDVKSIKRWLKYQNLPDLLCDEILETFLVLTKFNLEKTKMKLTNYFVVRKEIPDLYVGKNPKLQHMQDIANTIYAIPLPTLTSSLSRVSLYKLKDANPDNFNILHFFAHSYNIVEIRIREDLAISDTLIYDFDGFQWNHFVKMQMGAMRKSAKILEKVFSSRLDGLHYINMPSSLEVIISVVKPMLKEKLRKRLHVHKTLDSLQKHLPLEVLPVEYGGKELGLDVLHGLWQEKLKANQNLFDTLEKLAVPEKKETTFNDTNLRNLCID